MSGRTVSFGTDEVELGTGPGKGATPPRQRAQARGIMMLAASILSAGTLQAGSSSRPTGAYTHAQCEALNRQRNVDLRQQDRVTQAIMCVTARCSNHAAVLSAPQLQPRGCSKHTCPRLQPRVLLSRLPPPHISQVRHAACGVRDGDALRARVLLGPPPCPALHPGRLQVPRMSQRDRTLADP